MPIVHHAHTHTHKWRECKIIDRPFKRLLLQLIMIHPICVLRITVVQNKQHLRLCKHIEAEEKNIENELKL